MEDCINKTRKLVSVAFDYSKALGSLTKSFDAFSKWITIGKLYPGLFTDCVAHAVS